MADVIKRTANADGVYEYKKSVNTPDFPAATWLINPDVSALSAVPQRHWKVVGETVVEMSTAEKTIVDAPTPPGGDLLHLKSPDGNVWAITITDAGVLSASKV